jgi:hypothetical protein
MAGKNLLLKKSLIDKHVSQITISNHILEFYKRQDRLEMTINLTEKYYSLCYTIIITFDYFTQIKQKKEENGDFSKLFILIISVFFFTNY